MKYKCLILDHDDTVVNSTATIHYPCFIKYLRERIPSLADKYTLKDYFVKNFHPGVLEFFCGEIGLSDEEMREEEEYWADYVKGHIPSAYDGIGEIISRFKAEGGIVAVCSHSYKKYIERDYKHNSLTMPDVIYGWEIPKPDRKPSPKTVIETMERYGLSQSDVLVVDDLKPGYDMARSAGVDFAAAGWAYDVPEIEEFMRENCDFYLKRVEDLKNLLFGGHV